MSSVWLSLIAGEVVALLEALGHIWGFDTVRVQCWRTTRAPPSTRKLVGRNLQPGHDSDVGCNPELDLHPAIYAVPSACGGRARRPLHVGGLHPGPITALVYI